MQWKKNVFWKARQLEEKGECLPDTNNVIFIADLLKNSIKDQTTIKEKKVSISQNKTFENETQINKSIIDIEENQMINKVKNQKTISGLYYTVQIGVYNKAVKTDRFPKVDEIMNIKLSNGQYRYSTGMFKNTIEASKRKKEVVQNGISDAFVVAYYNGKRISLRKAKELVFSKGEKNN